MPQTVIIICFILGVLLHTVSYVQRFQGLHRRTYEMNPITPLVWLVNTLLAMVFLAATDNWWLFSAGVLSVIYTAVFFGWSVKVMREDKRRRWKIQPIDYFCFGLAILAAGLFYVTGNAALGALIVFVGGMLGEVPQLRKDFVAPRTDSMRYYLVPALRYFILTGTLTHVNFVGLSNSLFWGVFLVAEAGWIAFCQVRARVVKRRALAPETVTVSVDDRS